MTKAKQLILGLLLVNYFGLTLAGSALAQNYSSTTPVTAVAQPITTPTPVPVVVATPMPTPVPTPTPTPVPTPVPTPTPLPTPSPIASPVATSLPVTGSGNATLMLMFTLGIATCIFSIYQLKLSNTRK
ncbi:hypothetical protein IJJ08_00425 [bacterium]|nr:hypothetical protein [bacterium]